MPDFLEGKFQDHLSVPPDTNEKMKAFSAFIQGPASFSATEGAIPAVTKDITEKSDGKIEVDKYIEAFMDMPHGWMAARGNLKDAHCKAEFERAYNIVSSFLNKYLL
ncbi:hypothetical protein IQ07DRAFT_650100 [Pyrenochaeta sp. DS3sAY3a]|nr:hypothetical protein IQ07DRAFT_650100 [Pyrenochaeta sp. DS3sAY3a]